MAITAAISRHSFWTHGRSEERRHARSAVRWLTAAAIVLLIVPGAAVAASGHRASCPAPQKTQPAGTPKTKKPKAAQSKVTGATSPTSKRAQTAAGPSETLGTFDITGAAQMARWKAAGGSAIVLPVMWSEAQPRASGPVSVSGAGENKANVLCEIENAHKDGLTVYLELAVQYTPGWVQSGVPELVDQDGMGWSSAAPGANVRDWIWSEKGRQDVAGFVRGALKDLAPVLGEVAGIRSGGGVDGELDFPSTAPASLLGSPLLGSPESYWGYDPAAQMGVGLAPGESATPLPGYVYGTGTAAQNAEWASWYLGSLATWIKWYAQLLRSDGWSGPTYVLHPSFGLRPDFAPTSTAYEQQLASGTDPVTMMDAYDTVSNVWPWCTWADDTEPYYHPGDPVVSDWAAWRYLLLVAAHRGLAAHIMGENTGGGGAAAIQQMMSGALAAGYKGVFYLDYPSLVAQGLSSYLVQQFDADAPRGG